MKVEVVLAWVPDEIIHSLRHGHAMIRALNEEWTHVLILRTAVHPRRARLLIGARVGNHPGRVVATETDNWLPAAMLSVAVLSEVDVRRDQRRQTISDLRVAPDGAVSARGTLRVPHHVAVWVTWEVLHQTVVRHVAKDLVTRPLARPIVRRAILVAMLRRVCLDRFVLQVTIIAAVSKAVTIGIVLAC